MEKVTSIKVNMTKQQVIALMLERSSHDPVVKSVLDCVLAQVDYTERVDLLKCIENHYDSLVGNLLSVLMEQSKSLKQSLVDEIQNRQPAPIIIRK